MYKIIKKKNLVFISCILILFICIFIGVSRKRVVQLSVYPAPTPTQSVTPFTSVPATISPTPTILPINTITPTPIPQNKILFGIGSQAGPAMDYKLVREAPVHMLSSWYNGPSDLEWMRIQQHDLIPRLYAKKYIVHLITWTDLPEVSLETPHGPACGRPYPVSSQILDDMKQLAQIYAGSGPLYVTLFTEFQTYTCDDNNWIGNENYYNTLKDNYRKIKDVFHTYAPKSKVALSWGGWSNRYDDAVHKGGRSLFSYFDDVLKDSDFTAFQTMESDTNVNDMLGMTQILRAYRKPIMLAHYKPSSGSSDVFDADIRSLFTDKIMGQLIQNGLFAFSFMDDENINKSETSYTIVKSGIIRYGK